MKHAYGSINICHTALAAAAPLTPQAKEAQHFLSKHLPIVFTRLKKTDGWMDRSIPWTTSDV